MLMPAPMACDARVLRERSTMLSDADDCDADFEVHVQHAARASGKIRGMSFLLHPTALHVITT